MIYKEKIEKPILIWGTGIKAVRFWNDNKGDLNIIAFADSSAQENDKMLSLPVYNIGNMSFNQLKKFFIIFCGSEEIYERNIRIQLIKKELCEFSDFAYYKYLTHELIYIHGNCHVIPIETILKQSVEFNNKYHIIHNKTICEYKKNEEIPDYILKNIDYYIHMDIRRNNEYGYQLSDEYVMPKLNENCKTITIPNLYGAGKIYFPLLGKVNNNNIPLSNGKDIDGLFLQYDEYIENMLDDNKTEQEIIEEIYETKGRYDDIIFECLDETFNKIRKREEKWDIKVLSYIIENYKKRKLFYDIGHHTEILIAYISKELLGILGINSQMNLKSGPMSTHELPIYPFVAEVLRLEFKDEYIRRNELDKKLKDAMDLAEYIREYIYWRKISCLYR